MKRQTIGGSLFVRNGIRYDYCFQEAILSLLAFCDQVSVLDCGSDDGTLDALKAMAKTYKALQVHANGNWNCSPGRERLSILANQAKSCLDTDWHFMLQADEVVHESSIPFIKEAVSELKHGWHCRRWNLSGNFDLCVRLNSDKKPCGDRPVRLANITVQAVGDGEGLDPYNCGPEYEEKIVIIHYGLVRRGNALIKKCLDMQQWFFGNPDPRLLTAKQEGVFTASDFIPESELTPLPCSHPVYMKDWIAQRANDETRRTKRNGS